MSYDGTEGPVRLVPALSRSSPAETNKLDKANVPEDAFYHLFEMNLDGSGVRQLTRGKYDDFDGRYLPDGRIVFLSHPARAGDAGRPRQRARAPLAQAGPAGLLRALRRRPGDGPWRFTRCTR